MTAAIKAFESMTPDDYAAIGLRCGLEVHQQLLTRTKLFCRCPAGRYSSEYDAEILRHMRPTLSELGEYDGTALMEKKTKKNIFYRINSDTVCTYEFDDTPPFFLAQDALDTAIELAIVLNLNMVGELHIARKQYLDGSIPAGFQRTTILGVNGWLPYQDRRIGVAQLGLEEDACREVSDTGHDRVLLTDRLGVPLIEVVTNPDMHTPEETAEVCEVIRRLCRSTGKVRRGYGAAREDVNVSVRGGTRIEIKGVPQISRIPRLVYNEARRQCSLLGIRDMLRDRGVTAETLRCKSSDVTSIVAKTRYEPMRSAVAGGQRVRCLVLKNFAGLLNESTQEHTTFAKEFSDRIKVIACLTTLPNMVHSDIASETLYGKDWQRLRRRLRADEQDALILMWGSDEDTQTACEEIEIRAREATIGIPSDTRQGLKDGTNAFERILPGAERMYPDTDLPPLVIDDQRIADIRARRTLCSWEREAKCRRLGIDREDLMGEVSISTRADLFFRIVEQLGIHATFTGVVLFQIMKAMERAGLHPDRLSDKTVYDVFDAYAQGRLAREGVPLVLRYLLGDGGRCAKRGPSIEEVLSKLDLSPLLEETITDRIRAALETLDHDRFSSTVRKFRHLMGVLMADCRGRVNGERLSRLVAGALEPCAPTHVATGSPG